MQSLWIKTEKDLLESERKLDKKIDTEVCIIGGGITGITAGYLLSKERQKCSYTR